MHHPANSVTDGNRSHAWILVVGLSLGAFTVSARLLALEPPRGPGDAGTTVAAALLGESRKALAGSFYTTADLYLHRGVGHKKTLAFRNGLFQGLNRHISPDSHAHVHGDEVRELMPWLWLTLRMDPSNTEAYLVSAFWLARDGGRPDLALKVLDEAQRNIPYNDAVQIQKGRLYLRSGDIDRATRAFDAALAFWPGTDPPESEDALYRKASAMLYRSLLHERAGEKIDAARYLREILQIFPQRSHLRNRLANLEKQQQPSVLAASLWEAMLTDDDHRQSEDTCGREDDHGQEHEHH
ncbi:MAG: hypothetical protein HQ559_08785 [Lentisphaerae bacterium]|nr:hypothetical protein [Lentisphaerota bacterium]